MIDYFFFFGVPLVKKCSCCLQVAGGVDLFKFPPLNIPSGEESCAFLITELPLEVFHNFYQTNLHYELFSNAARCPSFVAVALTPSAADSQTEDSSTA